MIYHNINHLTDGSKVEDKPPLIYLGFTQVRILYTLLILRDRAEVARKAHNLEVTGSIPVPATDF